MDPKVDGIKVLDIPYTATWAAMESASELSWRNFECLLTNRACKTNTALLETGKCKNIGISSMWLFLDLLTSECMATDPCFDVDFSKSETETLLASCKVRPAVHQMERHPYCPQHKFVDWHKEVRSTQDATTCKAEPAL